MKSSAIAEKLRDDLYHTNMTVCEFVVLSPSLRPETFKTNGVYRQLIFEDLVDC